MSSNVVQRGNRRKEDEEDPEQDKANRIAANLARLDASTSSSFLRAPLQWKGYGWRFMRGDASIAPTIANGETASTAPSSSTSASTNTAGETSSASSWKQWASTGIKKRSCKVITILLLAALIVGVSVVFAFSNVYAWVVSTDPCVVSRETARNLIQFPRQSAYPHSTVLPKIIHQQWKTTSVPEGVYTTWRNKFKELFPEPEYTHMLWTDENARELISKDFPFFLPAYDGYEFGIQRADAVRYFILFKYGGLYADLDYEPLVNFWEHLPKDRVALVESAYLYNEKSQNSLMSSPAGDPFWNLTFNMLIERKDRAVLQATGPMFLDALMARATETFNLLPCENFQRLPLHLSAEEEVSPFMSRLHREVIGRLAPMKSCGDYHDNTCQYGKHHNTASYLPDTGVWKLLVG